jgi:hypothetical protein
MEAKNEGNRDLEAEIPPTPTVEYLARVAMWIRVPCRQRSDGTPLRISSDCTLSVQLAFADDS